MFGLAWLCLGTVSVNAQQVWLGVRGPDVRPVGAADWNDLFKPTPEWSAVAAKVQVFAITAGYVLQTPAPQIKAALTDLANRHIKIVLGMQSVGIQPGDQCGHEEGYQDSEYSEKAAMKLRSLGIDLSNLALDEPVWFGHYDTGDQGCRFETAELAKRVAANVNAYAKYFPKITIGEVEPVPLITTFKDWRLVFETFSQEITHFTGKKLKYLQTDVNWRDPGFSEGLGNVAAFARSHNLKFGIIYNADGSDTTSEAWVAEAIHHFEIVESVNGILPDQVVFETWDQVPTHVLPETANDTLSHILYVHLLPQPSLKVSKEGNTIRGTLKDMADRPIEDASIVLKTSGLIPKQGVIERVLSGIVPQNVAYAIIGLRVNMECLCKASNDLLAGDLTFNEEGELPHYYGLVDEAKVHNGQFWNGIYIGIKNELGHPLAHIVVPLNQHFGFNSDIFSVTPGKAFTLRIPLASVDGHGMAGSATVIWFDKDRHGVRRSNLYLGFDESVVATTRSDKNGEFSIFVPPGAAGPLQTVEFGGDAHFRGAGQRLE
jgi:hypothetical protein